MMALYEATNGYTGQSYVRCYVWADSSKTAEGLAVERFGAGRPQPNGRIEVRHLFDADAVTFCTVPSDDGFDMDEDA